MMSRMAGLRFLGRNFSTKRPAMLQHSRVTLTAAERTSPLGDSNVLAVNSMTDSRVRPSWPALARPFLGMSSFMMDRRPSTMRHTLWDRTGFTSGPDTSVRSELASSMIASLDASRTLACASPSFSISCGTSWATLLCTSRPPSSLPITFTALVSNLHALAKTLATLSLNRRVIMLHIVRNTSRVSAFTDPVRTCSSILASAASRCIQFLEYRHIAAYSPNASTTGPASVVNAGGMGSGAGRSGSYPSGGLATPAGLALVGWNSSSSRPAGTRLRPVAPAGTSSLLYPCAEASTSRKRWGVDPSLCCCCIAALDTAGRSS
mmetsp:Transcript_5212/g.14011  ORF Transcript_5212/g.14011 Transcript_5212/m.14011 type:complete len:320 (-) Transcript_5212:1276-2235(-)